MTLATSRPSSLLDALDLVDLVGQRLGAPGAGTPPDLAGVAELLVGRLGDGCEIVVPVQSPPGSDDSVALTRAGAPLEHLEVLAVPLGDGGGGVLRVARADGGHSREEIRLSEHIARRIGDALVAHRLAVERADFEQRFREAVHTREKTLSIVSHDLKNPLQVVVWNARQLKRLADKGDTVPSSGIRRIAEWFESASKKMTTIVDDLLDASRLQAGRKLQLELGLVDLVPLVRRLADEAQQDTSRHTITVEPRSAEIIGRWDAQRIERVLGSLIGNAVKYSPQGGQIRIGLAEEPDPTGAGPGEAVVSIEDEGIGVPEPDRELVFEWFRRASNVPAHLDGTGIGLPSARLIAEQHAGRVDVAGRQGPGSVFTLRLPLATLAG